MAFRAVRDNDWTEGLTVDISRSGVLFIPVDRFPPEGASLQIVLYLSRTSVPTAMPDVYCGGRVARVTNTVDGRKALAVQIDYQWASTTAAPLWNTGLSWNPEPRT